MPAILLLCLSTLCFGYAAVAFCGRGPLISTRSEGDGEQVRAEYRAIALSFTGFGLCLFSFACLFAFHRLWLAWLSVALSAPALGGGAAFYLRALR